MFRIVVVLFIYSNVAFNDGDYCRKESCEFSNDKDINVIIVIVNAEGNDELQSKFRRTFSSMIEFTTKRIRLNILIDDSSFYIISNITGEHDSNIIAVRFLKIDDVVNKLKDIIEPMQEHFSSQPNSYYNHALFFISVALHKLLSCDKVIMLDADLKFKADISQLNELFKDFNERNIIGIAREAQPVYRHIFNSYRNKNPGTRVGEPPPHGLTGFNSGVLLLNLDRMRVSKLYNDLLNVTRFLNLIEEFEFQGHLGDQDFYTLLSMKYEELFYVLPCQWNRQLCQWWRNHGYMDVFEEYFKCEGDINIYHGNCNTNIP